MKRRRIIYAPGNLLKLVSKASSHGGAEPVAGSVPQIRVRGQDEPVVDGGLVFDVFKPSSARVEAGGRPQRAGCAYSCCGRRNSRVTSDGSVPGRDMSKPKRCGREKS
ncbi:hypothetical protein PG994_012270 [Apiospora phragmitis]|uniref:Uncharacterized protein n=1 Tax=Apiospora phragmitis TaxID=2905665 RepID=A0ABR1TXE5_9PEZI